MKFKKDVYFSLFILLILTIIIYKTNIDIYISSFFYSSDGWFLGKVWWTKLLYKVVPFIALSVSFLGLSVFVLSHFNNYLKKFRITSLYLILCMAIGPGLIVNAILKDNYGRPRPRHIKEFNGKDNFHKILIFGTPGKGKSFPSGHASMGFYFFALYFLARKRKWRLFWFNFTILLGSLIGFVRIVQGGHFFSDVVWSGFIIYFVSRFLYLVMNIEQNYLWDDSNYFFYKRNKRKILLFLMFIPLIIFVFFFIAPYYSHKTYKVLESNLVNFDSLYIETKIDKQEIEILFCDSLLFFQESHGYGTPWSKIRKDFFIEEDDNKMLVYYKTFTQNFFTKLDSKLKIYIPKNKYIRGSFILSDCIINYNDSLWISKSYDNVNVIKTFNNKQSIKIINGG